MKILKHRGTYLEHKAKLNRNISIPLLIIGLGGLLYSFLSLNFSFIYLSIIILVVGRFFFKSYSNYKGGLDAENLVIKSLSDLSDDYYLINDIKLRDSYGNIDHIVLGPNGIFVIETKNYGGQLICNGDEWIRHYEGGLKISMRGRPYWAPDRDYNVRSPSKQAKRNAVKIKQIVESSKIFKKSIKIWIEGIVVFTNPDVNLQLTNTSVTVVTIDELYNYIINKKPKIKFSSQELESIGKSILRWAEAN
ncbi:MAG: NERD domain-containing protein [Thermoplasmata archaeon]|nr:NERD domain-containing protein [Thermoplasmata archaeon]